MAAELRVGNVGTTLLFTVKNQSGTAKNLTGATVSLFVQRPDPDNRVLSKSGTLVTPASGTFWYTTIAGDLNVKGTYRFQCKVVLSGTTLFSDYLEQFVHDNLFQ